MLICLAFVTNAKADNNRIYDLVDGQDYYIYSTYYERVLSPSSDNTYPCLVEYQPGNDAKYLFTATKSATDGYFRLQNKATGRYLVASTSNSYSVLLNENVGTGNAYDWRLCLSTNGQIVSRRSTSAALGVDTEETGDAIKVWYDKTAGDSTTYFQIFASNGQGFESSRKAWAISDLSNIVDFIDQEITSGNKKYPLIYRSRLPKSVENARAWIAAPETKTTEQFMNRTASLRDSLGMMIQNDCNVLLTAEEMNSFGATFSLGLSDFTRDGEYAEDSVYVLLRSKEGRGMLYSLKESGDYVFIYQGTSVKIYHNGSVKEEYPTHCVPQYTLQGLEAEWSLIRRSRMENGMPELLSETKAVTTGGGITVDKYGNNTRRVIALNNAQLDLTEQIDLHIISESAPLTKCKINLAHEKAWIIFDNTLPSDVIKNYLSQITIDGAQATNGTNCRVVIYLNGALVMPFYNKGILTGYDGEQYSGEAIEYRVGTYSNLSKNANRIRSFRLKRGYMATLASGKDGSGYSRVYVADHKDIEIPVLPKALYGRISSITVKKWQYVSKKGWCSTTSNSAIATECKKMRATWFYTWSADRSSTYDTEYIPIRQHIYWPSISQIAGHTDATACLSFNEPEHSEQHTDCACGGVISEWTACTHTPDFQSTGMRIGSPAPTDASWLTNYINNCNNMAYRCDFVVIHAYWGTNEAANAQSWYNQLKSIYNNTKRPIWITEWNNGASWTTESWPSGYSAKLEKQRKAIKEIQNVLDTCSFVERYAVYNWDTYYRAMINWDDGNVLPAGKVYRDSKSDFAYNANVQFTPVWWSPSLKTPSMTARINDVDQTLVINIENKNADVTDVLTIQSWNPKSETWEDYYTETERYLFDNETLKYQFPLTDFDIDNTQLRVYIKRTLGDEATSPAVTTGYVQNPKIQTTSKSDVPGWNCQKSATAGFTKEASGDTYLEVWNANAAGMQFDYYQDIYDLPSGVYELSAAVFNSTDNVENAKVNGSVVLYAQSDSVQYLAPVTEDSQINYERRTTIPGIVVLGGHVRIGIKNLGEMSARWAGGDDFKLIRTGDLDADSHRQYMEALSKAEEYARTTFFSNGNDASSYVINPSCQRNDTYGWTVENNGTNSGEAADGQTSNTYWNLWKSNAFTSTMTQDVTYLPEGKYSAKALLRGSTSERITLSATVISPNSEETTSQSTTITPTGNTSQAGSPYQFGWMLVETPYVTVRPGETLRITLEAKVESGSGWWSADDFGLTWQYVEPLPDGVEQVGDASSEEARNKTIYDISGRKVSTLANRLKKGLYIQNGKKTVVR